MTRLSELAQFLVKQPKGILAADESNATMDNRLLSIGLDGTEFRRKGWRELIFSTPDLNEYVSGIIMYDETVRQKSQLGQSFVGMLTSFGIVPGVKVDTGTEHLVDSDGEFLTHGLDGLSKRLREYKNFDIQFTKWRSVLNIGPNTPSDDCIRLNANRLSKYASIAQREGFVPIVEPEVLMDGDHSLKKCYEVTDKVLNIVFSELSKENVKLNSMILKPNMILSGRLSDKEDSSEEVAVSTLECLIQNVPKDVPGIAFLSGGQEDSQATRNLFQISRKSREFSTPWELTFSFGRAVLSSALHTWNGNTNFVRNAQDIIINRLRSNSNARVNNPAKI
ncbi:MAG: fructose-bisphosphate aldolase class I [Dehalococcoidia bacterium]|jgi:fructose-bisphosphate aldolase class I|nr:fructose-bisphosphate aldolase class I [Chloroflexota bacterium]MDP7232260.1 fructose-bisphosphate aldolase class I [Dehalococcoidia bacterium]MDP7612644.1 fructose-bisphosphate aldolase class I [Dehalococcoidia bacterium]